jgi:hypothetical protein
MTASLSHLAKSRHSQALHAQEHYLSHTQSGRHKDILHGPFQVLRLLLRTLIPFLDMLANILTPSSKVCDFKVVEKAPQTKPHISPHIGTFLFLHGVNIIFLAVENIRHH